MVEAWRASGEPAAVFARRHGVQSNRIKYWAARVSRADEPPPKLALVPATVVSAELTAVIRAGDVTIELSNATPEHIAAIVRTLARTTP